MTYHPIQLFSKCKGTETNLKTSMPDGSVPACRNRTGLGVAAPASRIFRRLAAVVGTIGTALVMSGPASAQFTPPTPPILSPGDKICSPYIRLNPPRLGIATSSARITASDIDISDAFPGLDLPAGSVVVSVSANPRSSGAFANSANAPGTFVITGTRPVFHKAEIGPVLDFNKFDGFIATDGVSYTSENVGRLRSGFVENGTPPTYQVENTQSNSSASAVATTSGRLTWQSSGPVTGFEFFTTEADNDNNFFPNIAAVCNPSIALEKTGVLNDGGDGRADVGDTITYTFTVKNLGDAPLSDIAVTDTVLGGVIGTVQGLAAGASDASITGRYTLQQADIDAGRFESTAMVSALDPIGALVSDISDDPANPADIDPNGDGNPDDPTVVTLPQAGAIALEKTGVLNDGGDGRADAGDMIDYAFTLTNTGNVTLSDIAVTDTALGGVIGTVQGLAAGASDASITGRYTLQQADIDAGRFENTATVSATAPLGALVSDISDDPANPADIDPNGDGNPDDPTVVTLPQAGAIALEKTGVLNDGGDGQADAGDMIDYTFTLTNIGNVTLNNVTLSDPLLDASNGTLSGGPIASLTVGARDSATFTGRYTLQQADIDAGRFENTAMVSALDPLGALVSDISDDSANPADIDPNGDGNPDDPTVVTLPQAGAIALEKTGVLNDGGDGRADAGDVIDYTFTLTNTGNVTLSEIAVTDTALGGMIGTVQGLAAGASDASITGRYTLQQADIDAGRFENTATVSATAPLGALVSDISDDPANAADIDPNGDGNPDDPTVVTLPQAGAITLEKTGVLNDGGDGRADAGDVIDYAFTLTNTGNVTLNNVTLSDSLLNAPNGTLSGDPIASLTVGAHDSATFTGRYTLQQADIDAGRFENTATVNATAPLGALVSDISDDPANAADIDPNGDGNPDDPTVVTLPQAGAITLEKTGVLNDGGDGRADAGDVIDYTFTLTNTGNVTLSEIAVTDTALGGVIGTVQGLAAGASDASITGRYTLQQADIDAGRFENSATVSALDPLGVLVSDISDDPANPADIDPNGDGNPDDPTVVTLSQASAIGLEKTGVLNDGGDGRADAGDVIDYAFTLTNIGNVTLSEIAVTDTVLGGMIGTVQSLAAGASDASITGRYTLQQADIDAGRFENTATVSATAPLGALVSDISDDPVNPADTDPNGDGNPDDPTVVTLPQAGAIALEKTGVLNDGGDGQVDAGDVIDYTFTLTNIGNVTLNNVMLSDLLLDAPTVILSGDPIASLTVGARDNATFTGRYTLQQADIDAGRFENTATVSALDPLGALVSDISDDPANPADIDPNGDGNPDDPTVVTLPQAGAIALEKTGVLNDGGDGRADAGDVIDYTFTLTNIGNVTLSEIAVTDTALGGVIGTVQGLAAGASDASITGRYTLQQADIDAGRFENTATVSALDPLGVLVSDISDDPANPADIDPNGDGNPDDPTVVALPQAGAIALEKTGVLNDGGDGRADAGDVIDYAFTLTNIGNVTLNNVTLSDPLLDAPNGTLSGDPIASLTVGARDSATFTGRYTLQQADIDAGRFENTATVNATAPLGALVSDISDDPANPADIDPNGDGNPDDPTVVTLPQAGAIALEKTGVLNDGGDGRADAGDVIDYTFTLTNTGNVTLSGIAVTDTALGGVIGTVQGLAAGASDASITGRYTLQQADIDAGRFENTAMVSATAPLGGLVSDISDDPANAADIDPNSDGNPDDPTVVTLPQAGAITLEKTGVLNDGGDGRADAGDVIDYAFTLTNTGNVTLSEIAVTDTVLGGVIGTVQGLAAGASDASITGRYTLQQADIDAGRFENTATVSATAPLGGLVSDISDDPANPADIDPNGDGNPDDPTVVTLPQAGAIALEKTGVLNDGGDGRADAGDVIDYTFTLTNTGNVTLNNVTLSDPLLDAPNGTLSGGPIASLTVGARDSATFTGRYTLQQADIDAGRFENTATVSALDPLGALVTDISDDPANPADIDPNGDGNPDDPTVVTLSQAGAIALEKTGVLNDGGDGRADAGDVIDYAFTLTNIGNVTLNNVTLSDPLLDAPNGTLSGGPIASLTVGARDSATFTGRYTLQQADIDAGRFENTATVSALAPLGALVSDISDDPANPANIDPNGDGNPDDPTVVTLPQAGAIALEKTGVLNDGGDGRADAGNVIDYAFTLTNTGNVTLSEIAVTDTVLGGMIGTVQGLAAGASDTSITGRYTLQQADIDAGRFENTATVSALDPLGALVSDISDDPANPADIDPNGDGNPDDPTVVTLPQAGAIALEKTGVLNDGGDGRADAGDVIDYTFTLTNIGNVTLNNVTLSDLLLDAPTVILSGDPIASLTVGARDSATFTGRYTLQQADIDAGRFENTATVSALDPLGALVSDISDDPANPADIDPNGDGNPDDPTVVTLPQAGAIALEKTGVLNDGGDGRADAGDVIDYAFTLTNTGNVTLNNVTLSDPLLDAPNGTLSGDPIASLTVGARDNATFTGRYTLQQADIDAGRFENTATVSALDPLGTLVSDISNDPANPADIDPNGDGNPDDPTVVTLPQAGAITLEKTGVLNDGGDGRADAGDVIDYTFTLTNTGNVTLNNVTLSDPLLDAPNGTLSGGSIASLTVGAHDSATFTGRYTLQQADIDVGRFENTATVSALDPLGALVSDISDDPANPADIDPNGDGNPDDPTVVTLPQAGAIALEKTGVLNDGGDGRADAGDVIDYTFTLTNIGNVTLNNVTLSDLLLDAPTVILSGDPIASLTVGARDSATFIGRYTLQQADIDAGRFENTATVSATAPLGALVSDISDDPANPADIDPNGDGNPDDPTVVTLPQAGAITLEKTGVLNDGGDGRADAGDVIDYTFTLTNIGNVTLSELAVTDTALGGVIGTVQGLAAGASDASITGRYTLQQADIDAGRFENTATVSALDPLGVLVSDISDDPANPADIDPNGDGNPDDPTVVALPQAGAIALEKTGVLNDGGDGRADAGDVIDYAFTLTNIGNVTLNNVTLSDPLLDAPNGTLSGDPIASLTVGARDSATFTGRYTLQQADIDAGRFESTAMVSALDPIGALVSDISDDPANPADIDPNGDGNPDDPTVVTLPQVGAIALGKTGVLNDGGDGRADAGDVIDYAFTLTNTGNVTLSEIAVTDMVLGGVTGTVQGLAAGASDASITGRYTLQQADIDAGRFENTATVSATAPLGALVSDISDDPTNPVDIDPNGDGNPDDPTVVTLPQAGAIALEKTGVLNDGGDGRADAGDVIDYAFTLTNTGNVTLNNVTLSDPLLDAPNGTLSGGPIASLTVGARDSATFTGRYTLQQADIDAGRFENTATVSATAPLGALVSDISDDPANAADIDPNGDGNPDDPTVVTLPQAGAITLEKTGVLNDGGDGQADAGDVIDYAFTLTNTGNVTLSEIAVTDTALGGVIGTVQVLAAGASDASITGRYTLQQADIDAGRFENTATVSALAPLGVLVSDISDDPANPADIDPNGDGNPDDPTVVTLPQAGAIALEKTGVLNDGGDGRADAGDVIDYAFTLINIGNVTLNNVTLSDPLLDAPNGTLSGGPITSLTVGARDSATFTGRYTLQQADIDAGRFENTATVSATAPLGGLVSDISDDPANTADIDPNGDGNPDDPTVVTLPQAGAIALEKTGVLNDGGDGRADAGDVIDYAFTLTNTGNVTLYNVMLSDPLLDAPNGTLSGGPIASLTVGARDSATFTGRYTLQQADIDVGRFANTATVSALDPLGALVSDMSDDPANHADIDPNGDGNPDDPTVVTLPQVGAIALEKTGVLNDGGDGRADAGDVIDYAFTLTNTGNVTLNNVTLSDPLLDAPNGTLSGGSIASLTVGARDSATFTGRYTLQQADIDAGRFENTATVSALDPLGALVSDMSDDPANAADIDPNGDGNPDDPTVVTLPQAGAITLEKTGVLNDGGDGRADAGDVIDYAFTLTNTGNVTLNNVTLSDPLLDAPNGTLSGGPIASLTVGARDNATFTGRYTLQQADIDAGRFENTATVSALDPLGALVADISDDPANPADIDPNGDGNPDDPTVVTLSQAGAIALEKTGVLNDGGDGRADAGDVIDYAFTLTNIGNVTLNNVTLSDPLLDAPNGTLSGGPIASLTVGARDSATFTGRYTLQQADIDAGRFENTATVSALDPLGVLVSDISDDPANAADIDPNGDGNPDDPTVVTLPQAGAIALEKTGVLNDGGDGRADAGDVIDYAFTLTNTGNVTLSEIAVTDMVLGGVIGTVQGLAAGASDASITGRYTLQQADIDAGRFENTATVSALDPLGVLVSDISDDPANPADIDPNGDGNPDDPTVVTLPQALFLRATLSVDKPTTLAGKNGSMPDAGDIIPYTLTVTNTGSATLVGLSLSSATGLVLGDCTATRLQPGRQAACEVMDHVISQSDMEADGVEHSAMARASNMLGTLSASDVSDTGSGSEITNDPVLLSVNDENPTNDPTVVHLQMVEDGETPLTATKSANRTSALYGGSVVFTLTFENGTLQDYTDVVLHDRLPAGLIYTPGSATVNGVERDPAIGATLSWDNVDIPAGGTAVVTLATRVVSRNKGAEMVNKTFATDPNGLILSNEATVVVHQKVEHILDCADLIGKVYDDLNRNGYQDEGEPGLADVRIATVRGELITTDLYGRYHVPCQALPSGNGSNVILKLDTRTLPSGFWVTTENPRVVRVTAGKMARINFGAAISNVIQLDLDAAAFQTNSDTAAPLILSGLQRAIDDIIATYSATPTTLRLRYHVGAESRKAARRNLKAVEAYMRKTWSVQSKMQLMIERELN